MSQDEFGLEGHKIEGRYEVDQRVAVGGFGVVYKGHHRALRTPVAIKVLKVPGELNEESQREFAKGFLAEAQTLAALKHPAVVRSLDFGVTVMPAGQNAPWMALEWVEGITLREHLHARRAEVTTPDRAFELLRPVLEAIASAHEAGVVHRDLKPANIMLPADPGDGPVSRVLDFGIAKAMKPEESAAPSGHTQTASNLSAFSVKYAAPEQVGGLRTGPWTDVHALALILTELLVGQDPYPGKDSMEVTAAVLRPQRPTPLAFGYDVGAWEPVLARAMSFRPAERFANARELLNALEASVPREIRKVGDSLIEVSVSSPALPVTSAPTGSTLRPSTLPSSPAPVAAPARSRRPWALVAAALALVGVVAGAGWALIGTPRREPAHKPIVPSVTEPTVTASHTPAATPETARTEPAPPSSPSPSVVTEDVPAVAPVALEALPERTRGGRRGRRHAPRTHAASSPTVTAPPPTELPRTAPLE